MESLTFTDAIFVGDVHLDDRNPTREQAFCRFLDMVRDKKPDHVFLMGDIFEFWFGYKYAMFSKVIRPVAKIAELRDAGIPITYLVGNHDFKPGYVFTDILRVKVEMRPLRIDVGAERLYISHGDEIDTSDRLYLLMRSVLRNRAVQFVFQHAVPVSLAWLLGRSLSDSSRKANFKKDRRIPDAVFDSFCRREKQNGVTVILHGHNHDPGLRTWNSGNDNLTIIDVGDWLGDCGHYVEYKDGLFQCKTWPF
ncbi:MAG: UDP-2,3-diacylglucosamine diphosphatase [bacterium]